MSKQSLLEEFEWRCITINSFLERDSLKQFLSKAIDQTREETIKEILSELRLKLRNTYKAEDIADTAFLTESDLEGVLDK